MTTSTFLRRLFETGPTTRLGRWCTPRYAAVCDPVLKADLNSRDNSVETEDMQKELSRKKKEVEACPWSHPTLFVNLYSYGR